MPRADALFIISSLQGASSRSLLAMVPHLIRHGFRISLISLETSPPQGLRRFEGAGCRVLDAPPSETVLREIGRADVVQLEWWNQAVVVDLMRSTELPPARLTIYCHVAGDSFPVLVSDALIAFADVCIGCSPYTVEVPAFGRLTPKERAEKTAMVYATTDLSRLEGLAPRPHEGFNVGYVGRLSFRKLHPRFIAMSTAVRVPEAHFIVCGGGPGGEIEILRRQAENLGSAERFRFPGFVEDIRSYFEIFDVYGYPLCENPGAELNLQEALYAGVPPVVFPLGGIRHMVQHEENGLVVHSEREYSAAIEYLYHHPGERRRLGEGARRFARATFGAERSAASLAGVFRELLKRPKRRRSWPADGDLENVSASSRGARWLVESLGEGAGPLRVSLGAEGDEVVAAADAEIAEFSEFALWLLELHARQHPEDGHLALWIALIHGRRGRIEEAAVGLERAAAWLREPRASRYLERLREEGADFMRPDSGA